MEGNSAYSILSTGKHYVLLKKQFDGDYHLSSNKVYVEDILKSVETTIINKAIRQIYNAKIETSDSNDECIISHSQWTDSIVKQIFVPNITFENLGYRWTEIHFPKK